MSKPPKKHNPLDQSDLQRLSDLFWDKHLKLQTMEWWLEQGAIIPEERDKYPEAAKAYALKNSKLYKALK